MVSKTIFIHYALWWIMICYVKSEIVIDLTVSSQANEPFVSKQELTVNLGSENILLIFYVEDYDLTVSECLPGYICPFNSTKPIPCPKGTYSNLSKAYDITQCLECPTQMACPEASYEPINCSISNKNIMSLYNKIQCNFTNETMPTTTTSIITSEIITSSTNIITSSTTNIITSSTTTADITSSTITSLATNTQTTTSSLNNLEETTSAVSTTASTRCTVGYYYNITLSKCTICPIGYYCPMGSNWPIPCPQGTYIDVGEGATSKDNCTQCVLGTYSAYEAQVVPCSPCPIDSVCVNPSMIMPCPQHTTSPQGSTSMIKCVCLAGYECFYKKQLVVRISVNTTQTSISELQNNTALIEALRSSVAKASNVDPSRIIFKGFRLVPKLPTSGRRLLALPTENDKTGVNQQQEQDVAVSLVIDNN